MSLHPVDHHIVRTLRAEGRLSTRALTLRTAHRAQYIRQRLDALTEAGRVLCMPVPHGNGTQEKQWEAV